MEEKRLSRWNFNWLEPLLLLAVAALLFQLFPSLWVGSLWALDFRNWSRTTVFAVNFGVLFALAAMRFGPDLYKDWRMQRDEHLTEWTKKEKQQELKHQREQIERLKEAQKRRLY